MSKRNRLWVVVWALCIIMTVALSGWFEPPRSGTVRAATKAIRPEIVLFDSPQAAAIAQTIVLESADGRDLAAETTLAHIQTVPLAHGEARRWAAEGCWEQTCAHVMFYDIEQGGTVEAIVQVTAERLLDLWQNVDARPLASSETLETAVMIANDDPAVVARLGEISADDLMMVPMNIWLLDDACAQNWCVDLTFHDPAGSGKILHVTVDMEQQHVARTFLTRGLENIPYRDLPPQRDAFSDGCHEANGWQVCWEMTAHDGLEYYDATYNGQLVFSSAKVGQVEVWYPSWPGGYRDEIGHSASVPPYFDTTIEEIEDGFEVGQLFTEFTRWPNCICCYRYDQSMAFYEDGTFEARFVSHGPGCDDLSVYQPLWRIDLDLDGPAADEAWLWQDGGWEEVTEEREAELILDRDLSPEQFKLATFDDELHYRWRYLPSDPLGLDEAKAFLLRWQEQEGDNPIVTGPANTFQPPRQWIDGDKLSGENITLWYVPLLRTKKGGPWWCMPAPGPDFSPCEAVLQAVPAGPLPDPEDEPPTILEATEIGTDVDQQPTPTNAPTAIPTAVPPTATPPQIEADDVPTLLLNSGCTACHAIGELGEGGKVGPDLTNIGAVAATRMEGVSGRDYIRRAILYPEEHIVADCPNGPCLSGIMPTYYGERLTALQLEEMVGYLAEEVELSGARAEVEETPEATRTPRPIAQDTEVDNIVRQTQRIQSGELFQAEERPQTIWLLIGLPVLLIGIVLLMVRRRPGGSE